MNDKEKELKIIKFLLKNKGSINSIQENFVLLFNKIGLKDESEQMQSALTAVIIFMLLKNSNMPPKIQQNILEIVQGKIAK